MKQPRKSRSQRKQDFEEPRCISHSTSTTKRWGPSNILGSIVYSRGLMSRAFSTFPTTSPALPMGFIGTHGVDRGRKCRKSPDARRCSSRASDCSPSRPDSIRDDSDIARSARTSLARAAELTEPRSASQGGVCLNSPHWPGNASLESHRCQFPAQARRKLVHPNFYISNSLYGGTVGAKVRVWTLGLRTSCSFVLYFLLGSQRLDPLLALHTIIVAPLIPKVHSQFAELSELMLLKRLLIITLSY